MLIFVIAVVVIVLIVVAALFMAKGTAVLDKTVQDNQQAIQNIQKNGKDAQYDPAVTMGYEISVNADLQQQLREARKLAAKQAAQKPRGANMGIGRLGEADELRTAWKGVENDPITAVKIAAHHGWDGLRTGAVIVAPEPVAKAAPDAAAAPVELIPGKDYPVIEITDDMSPADKRKVRIANAKAKSAANKAAKAGGAATAPAAAAAPTAVAIPEPTLIEITDDLSPEDTRKARIANSKAKSAYKKALKAAGIDPTAAAAPAAAPAPEAAPTAEPTAAAIPEPTLIEITDDMAPEDIRAARIANSKAKSAYKKALKAAAG